MSSTSLPLVTCIPVSSLPPSPSPLAVSAPENMPIYPLSPQLAQCTEPLPVLEDVDDAAMSIIEYLSVVDPTPNKEAPVGFVPNNRDGRHFYPIYVRNPKFGKWDLEPKMVIANYIKYSLNYTSVTGSMGQGQEEHTLPVQVGCRAQYYAAMTTAMWRDLERGSSKEFAVNDCLADIGDARIISEVNQFRGYAELRQTLNGYLLEAQKEVTKVTKELLKVEEQLEQSRNRLEKANIYQELQDQFSVLYPHPTPPRHTPVRIITHITQSPECTPMIPCNQGPVEMPQLAEGSRTHSRKCYRCGSFDHLVSKCHARRRNTKCTLCGSIDHKSKYCSKRVIGKGEDAVAEPSPFAQALETQEMSLLDRISFLERSDWYPTSCTKCGRVDPKHSELECLLYESCPRCRSNGAYGYMRRHVCYPVTSDDDGWDNYEYNNDTDYDLYWGNGSN
jgi:hypothetical protein